MKLLTVSTLLLLRLTSWCQEAAGSEALLSSEQQKSDFRVLVEALDAYHPSAYRFVSRDSLQRSANEVMAGLNGPLSEQEFHLVVRWFLTQVHCGHTVAMPSVGWYEAQRGRAKIVPVEPLIVGDRLYLPSALPSDSLAAGKEIVSVNSRNATELLTAMRGIHSCDGFSGTFADHSIRSLFQTYYLFHYGSEPEYTFVYRDGNETRSAVVKSGEETSVPARRGLDTLEIAAGNGWSKLYISPSDSAAVLQIDGFTRGEYKKYYKRVFRILGERDVRHLVIDLRDNGGGYFPNGNRLLRYLSREPFTFRFSGAKKKPAQNPNMHTAFSSRMSRSAFRILPDPVDDPQRRNYEIRCKPKKNSFDGRLYVLMDGGSFSLSGYVAAFLQHRTDALMIGQETGGGEEGSNGILFGTLTLPASGIRVNVPYYHLDHQMNTVSNRGVMPDIPVSYSVGDLLSGTDLELKTALAEIRKHNTYRGTAGSER